MEDPAATHRTVFSLGCVFSEVMTLLLGHDLTELIEHSSIVVNEPSLDDAYHCNLDKLYSWLKFLQESQGNERAPFKLN